MQEKTLTRKSMHSVRLEPAKLILIGTRTTYQATGDAIFGGIIIPGTFFCFGTAVRHLLGVTTLFGSFVCFLRFVFLSCFFRCSSLSHNNVCVVPVVSSTMNMALSTLFFLPVEGDLRLAFSCASVCLFVSFGPAVQFRGQVT